MRLKDHDLKQINRDYLGSLAPDKLVEVSLKLLEDLKEAREHLNQTPQNSSRPSGSNAPWEGGAARKEKAVAGKTDKEKGEKEEKPAKGKKKEGTGRKAGKQPGAEGHGRKVALAVTGEKLHRAGNCAVCGQELGEEADFKVHSAMYVVDVEMGEPGLQVVHVKHVYGDSQCRCGHVTRTEPGGCAAEEGWAVALTERHLVGPTLVSLIICLSQRMRMSRSRIQEFLNDVWPTCYGKRRVRPKA